MADKVAVVTGSNKGIGFGIVRALCKRGIGNVYLTARNVQRGKEAIAILSKEGYKPLFYQLDVTDEQSVKSFAEHLKQNHAGLDILINNAAIATANFTETTYEDSVQVLNANYYSILTIQKYIFPLLKNNARVVNISSNCGHITNLKNTYWINRLTKDDINQEDIDAFVVWFLNSVKDGTLKEEDFQEMPLLAYRISKIAVCALTRLQQKEVERDISVNSLHPGFVKTDMVKTVGDLTIDEASDAPVYLALNIDQSVKGKYFWFDKTEKDWADTNAQNLYCPYALLKRYLEESKENLQRIKKSKGSRKLIIKLTKRQNAHQLSCQHDR
ncbi:carbonyl reductase [NADPH] 3-like isoform X2 [Bicyclus anynana]|uniref:Carbonyl reductase [NADPH] 3-like isoform X2 n=1 Tax=Bicyclus anynana TaxID=110368 RepID=A0ABM3LTL9_BICAN|nr:carbonyl reductase [NADPH] 3-like isoform X2 [Bicyclus anynana]